MKNALGFFASFLENDNNLKVQKTSTKKHLNYKSIPKINRQSKVYLESKNTTEGWRVRQTDRQTDMYVNVYL